MSIYLFLVHILVSFIGVMVYIITEKNGHLDFLSTNNTYALSRLSLAYFFILRLYHVFNSSAFKVELWKCIVMGVIEFIATVLYLIPNNAANFMDYSNPKIYLMWYLTTIFQAVYSIIDIAVNIAILGMFAKRLNWLSRNTTNNDKLFKKIIHKFMFLLVISATTTIIMHPGQALYYVELKHYNSPLEFLFMPFICLDSVINCYCVYYSMGFITLKYDKYCLKCEQRCLSFLCLCCIN